MKALIHQGLIGRPNYFGLLNNSMKLIICESLRQIGEMACVTSAWSSRGQTLKKYLTNLVFSFRTVSYGSSFFPLRFMARALRAWAINRRGKNSVHNLRYEPRTRLVRGIYTLSILNAHSCRYMIELTSNTEYAILIIILTAF